MNRIFLIVFGLSLINLQPSSGQSYNDTDTSDVPADLPWYQQTLTLIILFIAFDLILCVAFSGLICYLCYRKRRAKYLRSSESSARSSERSESGRSILSESETVKSGDSACTDVTTSTAVTGAGKRQPPPGQAYPYPYGPSISSYPQPPPGYQYPYTQVPGYQYPFPAGYCHPGQSMARGPQYSAKGMSSNPSSDQGKEEETISTMFAQQFDRAKR